MAKKKSLKSTSKNNTIFMITEKKLKIISRATCDGGSKIIAFYHPPSKQFYTPPFSYGKRFHAITLGDMFEKCLQEGTGEERFQSFLNIPDFKKLWMEITREFNPAFESGEQVVLYKDHTPEIWMAGDVVGYHKVCNAKGGGSKIVCQRHFTHDKTNKTYIRDESDFMPIGELKECKEAREIINKAVKELKGSGLVGGVFIHRAKAVRF